MSHNSLRPKLVLEGAAEALRWYADALGAELGSRYHAGDRVVFADLVVFGTTITLKDTDEFDPPTSPGPILDCVVDDPDAIAERMLAVGAEVVFPVSEQPYGTRGGRVRDPFGVQWLLQTPLALPPDEVQRAVEELA